jgi:predicted lipoprotein with Yx(FWY)xxD motif
MSRHHIDHRKTRELEMKLRRITPVAGLLAAAALGLSACGYEFAGTSNTSVDKPATNVQQNAANKPAEQQPQAAGDPAEGLLVVQVAQKEGVTEFLQTADGQTIYRSDGDEQSKPQSSCVEECAEVWKPVPADDVALVKGVDEALVGSAKHPSGVNQMTVKDWPLYTKTGEAPGEVSGADGKGDNGFFPVAPDGTKAGPVDAEAQAGGDAGSEDEATGEQGEQAEQPDRPDGKGDGLTVTDTKLAGFDQTILVNENGRVMYIFDADQKGSGKSACEASPGCDEKWPPVLADDGLKVDEDCVDPDLIDTFTRKDGGEQVTIDGKPLYYYFEDKKAGDTLGHGVGEVWWAATGGGERAEKTG